jgi:hypothetical protein
MGRYLDMLRCDESDISDQSHAKVDTDVETRAAIGVRSLLSLMSHSRSVDARGAAPGPEAPAVAAAERTSRLIAPPAEAEGGSPLATLIAPAQWFEGVVGNEPPYYESSPARRGVIRYPDGRFEHFCPVCGSWGAFGYGVTAERPGRWFCFRHRALGLDRPAGFEGVDLTANSAACL